jgi:hypothetical protein
VGPGGGTIYVWYDALINYITGPASPTTRRVRRWWPADLHVIGKDSPASIPSTGRPLWSRTRGAEEGLGPRLVVRWRRADEQEPRQSLDPNDVVAALTSDGLLRNASARSPRRTPRSAGTASSGATTPTSRTTSATSSTGACRW